MEPEHGMYDAYGELRARHGHWVAFAFAIVLATSTAAGAAEKMLMVSWDGVARNVLKELLQRQPASEAPRACPSQRWPATMPVLCGEYWSCLPNLCRFQVIDSWDSSGKPLTKPQHAQMLTGYGPATTGVFRNNGAAHVPEGFTVYERIKATHGQDLKTIHVAGRKYVSMGVVGRAKRNGSIDVNSRRGGPDKRTGRNTTARVLPLIEQYASEPFFMFVHYKEPDVEAHMNSADSAVYREAIILVDLQLGLLLDALDSAGAMPETSVLVTTDHGFVGRFHVSRDEDNTATWVAALNMELRTDREAKLLDVAPTILDYYGVKTAAMDPPLEGRSLLQPLGGVTTTTSTMTTAPATTTTTTAAP